MNAVLSHAGTKSGDQQAAELHASEVARLADAGAAVWTLEIVDALRGKRTSGNKRGQA